MYLPIKKKKKKKKKKINKMYQFTNKLKYLMIKFNIYYLYTFFFFFNL